MAKKPKLMPEAAKARIARSKHLSKLREKAELGTITEDEKQELANAGPPKRTGRPRKNASPSPSNATTEAVPSDGDLPGEVPGPGDVPPPPPPTVEVMPSVHRRTDSGGDWRSKYSNNLSGGRESICVQTAGLYVAVLLRLSGYIKENGGNPVISEEDIKETVFKAAVLTADKFLPDVDIGPEAELAIGSGLLMGQAAFTAARVKRQKANKPKPMVKETRVETPEPPADVAPNKPRSNGEISPDADPTHPKAVF